MQCGLWLAQRPVVSHKVANNDIGKIAIDCKGREMEKYADQLGVLGFRISDGYSTLAGAALDRGSPVTAIDQNGVAYRLQVVEGSLKVETRGRRIARDSYLLLLREDKNAIPS